MDKLEDCKTYYRKNKKRLQEEGYATEIEWGISEIERLEKEKKWLLNECAQLYVFEGKMRATATMKEARKWLIDRMQEALKE